jgi:F-type H+-transporting ATPase subunit delta
MKINCKQFAKAFVEAVEGKSDKEVEKLASEFVGFLSERGLMSFWRETVRSIDGVWKEKYGLSSVVITSAHPLSEKARKSLEKMSAGAEIIEEVKPELIGGAIVRVDDRIVDGSVSGALNSLKISLSK